MSELTAANEAVSKESTGLAQRVEELRSTLRKRNVELENAVSSWQDVSRELHQLEAALTALENKVQGPAHGQSVAAGESRTHCRWVGLQRGLVARWPPRRA